MGISFVKVDLKQEPNKREKIIFFLALFVFMLGFVKSCWSPSTGAISKATASLVSAVAEQNTLEARLGTAVGSQALKIDRAILQSYDKWANSVSKEPDVFLMREFSNPAFLRDIKLSQADFTPVKIEGNTLEQEWKIKIEGSFTSVGRYIEQLERLPLLLIIDSVSIEVVDNMFGHITADIEGIVYGWK